MSRLSPIALALMLAFVIASPVEAVRPWSIVASPNSGTDDNLTGVACPSATSCTAVGYYNDAGNNRTLIESWDGTAWSIISSPNSGAGLNILSSVSCVSATSCTAVGFNDRGNEFSSFQTLVESWDGTSWSVVSSPNSGTTDDRLTGVSCRSATLCTAVGFYVNASGITQTLIEAWDGTTWSIVASPNSIATDNGLAGVSCPSATACTAVGYAFDGSHNRTLIESWNGTSWSVASSPNSGLYNQQLLGVVCPSATACTAVGFFVGSLASQTLIESWDGATWSIVPSPNSGSDHNLLLGVSCGSGTSCAAGGWYFDGGSPNYRTLIESWDGTAWSVESSPNVSIGGGKHAVTYPSVIHGVACASSTACAAVGDYINSSNNSQTFVEMYGSRGPSRH
jgi:hypothetical protein